MDGSMPGPSEQVPAVPALPPCPFDGWQSTPPLRGPDPDIVESDGLGIDFILSLSDRIGIRVDTAGWQSVTSPESVICRSLSSYTLVAGAGFDGYFSVRDGSYTAAVVEACYALGLGALADAFARALRVWPGGKPPLGAEARAEWLDEHEDELDYFFQKPLFVVLDHEDTLPLACIEYARRHAQEFRDLTRR